MTLRGGAIIIGSLLWDTREERRRWRGNDLCCKDGFQVYVPIRYGRRSKSKQNTYTMVFSNKCYSRRYGLGIGWVLPLRAEITCFTDLQTEAQKMGRAEGFSEGLSSSWGSVALLLNPGKEVGNSIRIGWARLMSPRLANHPLLTEKEKSEKAAIDSNGFLTIRWPKEVAPRSRIEELDFLIATVTRATLINGRYPTAYEIADAMRTAESYDYFVENRKHGITTFQDESILGGIPTIESIE